MLIQQIKHFIITHKLIKPHDTIIVGLSGGPDSVFLLHALEQLKNFFSITLIAAHLDHQWRSVSQQDADFCKEYAQQLAIPCIISKASEITLDKKYNGSKEEYARFLRQHFFKQVAHTYNAQAIALAHHADDQQETFFIRLLRGATTSGLASIRPKARLYIRPLLSITKAEIIAYLDQHKMSYVQDSTNLETNYLRNKIRHQALPALRAIDNRFDKNFNKTLEHIQNTELFLERLTFLTFSTISFKSADSIYITIQISKLLACDSFLQPRLIVYWLCAEKVFFNPNTGLFQEIILFLAQPSSANHTFYNQWKIIKKKDQAFILLLPTP
jgi:tRNA(Ile)-lysidine synthase